GRRPRKRTLRACSRARSSARRRRFAPGSSNSSRKPLPTRSSSRPVFSTKLRACARTSCSRKPCGDGEGPRLLRRRRYQALPVDADHQAFVERRLGRRVAASVSALLEVVARGDRVGDDLLVGQGVDGRGEARAIRRRRIGRREFRTVAPRRLANGARAADVEFAQDERSELVARDQLVGRASAAEADDRRWHAVAENRFAHLRGTFRKLVGRRWRVEQAHALLGDLLARRGDEVAERQGWLLRRRRSRPERADEKAEAEGAAHLKSSFGERRPYSNRPSLWLFGWSRLKSRRRSSKDAASNASDMASPEPAPPSSMSVSAGGLGRCWSVFPAAAPTSNASMTT